MKKIYQTPSFDVVYYNSVSVISTSGEPKQSDISANGGTQWGNRHNVIWDEEE